MSTDSISTLASESVSSAHARPAWVNVLMASLRYREMKAGLTIVVLVIALSLLGPLVAPHSASELVGSPYSSSSSAAPLGTDFIGRDVLSRVLHGGRTVIGLSLAATFLGVALGVIVGMMMTYARGAVDNVLVGINDIVLAFPQIVLVLLFVAIAGPKVWLIVVVVAISHSPRVARLTRSVGTELRYREFVRHAEMTGAPRRRIILQELMPNLMTPLLVEFGLRMTWSIGIIAGLSFLGYGVQPPQADWGLMISENRTGLTTQSWSVVAPIICLFLFTVGTNLMTEGVSRAVARIEASEAS